jgi:hypothetical protein
MLFGTASKASRTQPSEARPRFMQQSGSSEARWVYRGSHLRSGGPCGSHLAPSGSLRVPSTGAAGATERCSLGVSGDAFTMSWTEREGPSVSAPTRRAQSTASDFRSVKKRAAQPSGGHRLCLGSSGDPTECKECL